MAAAAKGREAEKVKEKVVKVEEATDGAAVTQQAEPTPVDQQAGTMAAESVGEVLPVERVHALDTSIDQH